ncbi:SAF domain-containing protein [Gordonia sp. MP11Mi]|uniref:SAF domain-containing protein n=1 Tax=Gordonia sp. MP11Mi TaxID=3022769 RepID=A0AA97CUS2_9ACTN
MNRDRGRDLNPTIIDRLRRICAPGWIRSVFIRRAVAVALIVCAAAVTVAQQHGSPSSTTLVATRELRPSEALTLDDVRSIAVPEHLVPTDPIAAEDLVGRHVTGLVHTGEIIARHRLLDSRLPSALIGRPDARLVPVRPADDTLATFVRAGDVVDLLSEDARVLARGAVVAVIPDSDRHASTDPGTVLVAMGEDDAHLVASAGLRDRITFVLH